VLTEQEACMHDDSAVLEADRAHANDPALDKLVTSIVARELLELLSRDKPDTFGHRSTVSHGILASS
jgi:hypothetical protein